MEWEKTNEDGMMCCANTNASDSLSFNKDFGIKDIFEIHNSYRIVCPHSSIFLPLLHVFLPYQVSFIWEFIFVLLSIQLHSFSFQNLSVYNFVFCIPFGLKFFISIQREVDIESANHCWTFFLLMSTAFFNQNLMRHVSASVDVNVHLLFHCVC